MLGLMAHSASQEASENLTATRHGLLRRVATAAAALWRSPIGRPSAKGSVCRVVVGPPFGRDPVPPPAKPAWVCDYAPLEWL
jgi:hypothetical protein